MTIERDNKIIKVWKIYSQERLLNEIEKWVYQWENVVNENCETKMSWLLNNLKLSSKRFIVEKRINDGNEFFDKDLEKMRTYKNFLYKDAQHSNFNIEKWNKYKTHRDCYKKLIKQKKFDYIQKQFDKTDGDVKTTWRVLNSVIGNDKDQSINQIISNGQILSDKKIIANEFNKHFVDTIAEINQQIPAQMYHNPPIANRINSFNFEKLSINEIKKYLRDMKKKNNRDNYDISVTLMLDSMPLTGQIFANIFNESFDAGYFPLILRQATIVPIRKVANSVAIEEYRPINTLLQP